MSSNWNEIDFLEWGEFKRMAPSIIQLELTRLNDLIRSLAAGDLELHNTLIKVRFALKAFIKCLEHVRKEDLEHECGPHLQAALLNVSAVPDNLDEETAKIVNYLVDRLNYVYHRLPLIY